MSHDERHRIWTAVRAEFDVQPPGSWSNKGPISVAKGFLGLSGALKDIAKLLRIRLFQNSHGGSRRFESCCANHRINDLANFHSLIELKLRPLIGPLRDECGIMPDRQLSHRQGNAIQMADLSTRTKPLARRTLPRCAAVSGGGFE